jgi:YD repeat-containing protein
MGPPAGYAVVVNPDNWVGPNWPVNSTGHTATFYVYNVGGNADIYSLSCWGTGGITCTNVNPSSLSLNAGTMDSVIVTYSVGSAGLPVLSLQATGTYDDDPEEQGSFIRTEGVFASAVASDVGSYVITVGAPMVDVTPYNFDNQDYGRCANACFAATHAQSTVPYFSLGAPRNVTLLYNGDRLNPKPFILVDVHPDPGTAAPSEYRLEVKINGTNVTFTNGETTLRFTVPSSDPVRIGGQFTWTGATGVSPLDIIVSGLYSGGVLRSNVVSTKFATVNETNSAVAKGWIVGGIQRAYSQGDGSVLITEGDGSTVYFRKSGSQWIAPAGEFSTIISGIPGGGSGYTRLFADSTKIVFNSAGYMTEIRDRFSNTITIVYDGSNRVWKIKDPLDTAIVLSYNANGLSTIVEHGRTTTITVNASHQLTGIQDPDGVSTTFGYDGSDRLSTVTDRRGTTTTLAYDSQSGKRSTITAPSITYVGTNGADSTGSPVTTLAAWQKFGVPYSGTSGTAFTPPKADTVRATITEPGGAATRFTVNRWGAPVQVTAPLDYVTTVAYDANGLPVRITAPSGAVDTTAYNASGLPVYIRSALIRECTCTTLAGPRRTRSGVISDPRS